METKQIELHQDKVLWPPQMSIDDALHLKDTTVPHIWETTYQGNPTSPHGNIFQREWFTHRDTGIGQPIARIISIDTSLSDLETASMSAATVGELMPDYSLRITYVWAEHIQYPQLVEKVTELAFQFNQDNFLKWIVIEKKVSGFSLIQSLRQSTNRWIKALVQDYTPKLNKDQRYNQAAIWCKNGMVKLPVISEDTPWLFDFEEDLFSAPNIPFKDRMDSFAQMILYLANHLSMGYAARKGH